MLTDGNEQPPQPSASQSGAPQLSQIEKSVTHLLVATKQLLETLTQWSRHQATDAQVSDVYVRLGYEFNIACRAFSAINVETSDLGNVPEELRHILESTLSQEASVESLDRYLPKIRDIIIGLLHGLKRKQQKLRQKQARDGTMQGGEPSNLPRNGSVSSTGSGGTGLTTLLNEGIPTTYQEESYGGDRLAAAQEKSVPPPRTSSTSGGSPSRRNIPAREGSRTSSSSEQSSLSSNTAQNMPVVAPGEGIGRPSSGEFSVDQFPPPPPPKQTQNALAALQRGGDLERRASRRYSAYQISKHLGSSPIGVPMLPPAQNSPIPNRGRDLRESMNAVRGRGSIHQRQKSSQRVNTDTSPSRIPGHISGDVEILESNEKIPIINPPSELAAEDSPIVKTPDDKLRRNPLDDELEKKERSVSGTLTGPPTDALPVMATEELEADRIAQSDTFKPQSTSSVNSKIPLHEESRFSVEPSPPPFAQLTLFLQYKTQIKKFVLPGGYDDLSIARLQLAFIEKFAWNTHNNGVDLPEIYIQDPVSGVRHELEDLTDIKDRSVLVLNIEVLDEVKRHIDEGIGGLKAIVEGVRVALDNQKATIQRVSDRQQETAKEMAKLATSPPSVPPRASWVAPRTNGNILNPTKSDNSAQLTEIQSLRRDLAVLRQTYSGFQADIESSMSEIRTKAGSVKQLALKAAVPDVKADAGRSYVNTGKKNLNEESDKLVSRVDDLQDIVEDLRKDVVTRGVRPLPRQLENVAKDISTATQELKRMQEFLKRERPIWTKIWEKELETVCNDREEMTMQEDLAADLQDDLEKASQTFKLVEEATKEQLKDTPGGSTPSRMPKLNHVTADPAMAKEGVLGEVRALQPNHENRLEAIERAEKLRQKELESRRGGEFQKELGSFVEEGKLKKAGGYEEVERMRIQKDEKIRREVWERQNGMTQADAGNSELEEATEADDAVEGEGESMEATEE